jgi:uncharacterized protein
VKIEFGPAKSAKNASQRGLPLELTAEFDWSVARVPMSGANMARSGISLWFRCPEGLYAVCYCVRGDARGIISFRKANKREERAYAKTFG